MLCVELFALSSFAYCGFYVRLCFFDVCVLARVSLWLLVDCFSFSRPSFVMAAAPAPGSSGPLDDRGHAWLFVTRFIFGRATCLLGILQMELI